LKAGTSGVAALDAYVQADFPAIADLWVAAWRTTGFAIDFDARRDWLKQHLATLAAHGVRILVARDGKERPLGFVSIDPNDGYLDQLCVAPEAFGAGVGRALLREAMRLSPGLVELDVNEANARAVRFYRREGFRAVTRGLSAGSGLPTIRMRWDAAS
jgi:putative acetyltransferase